MGGDQRLGLGLSASGWQRRLYTPEALLVLALLVRGAVELWWIRVDQHVAAPTVMPEWRFVSDLIRLQARGELFSYHLD